MGFNPSSEIIPAGMAQPANQHPLVIQSVCIGLSPVPCGWAHESCLRSSLLVDARGIPRSSA